MADTEHPKGSDVTSSEKSDSIPAKAELPKPSADGSTDQKNPTDVKSQTPPEETKQSIRLKVWGILEKNNSVLYPRPLKGRVPHFVGSLEAANNLATLDVFKNAQNIKINPDKPQAHVRFLTLEAGKTLLVPVPRLRTGLFKKIEPTPEASKQDLKAIVTQQGIMSGKDVGFEDKVKIDLIIMGAVAVSKEGYRIGKGEGYSNLEYAVMKRMGAVTDDTIVITTVHDDQVFDTLPSHLFKEHDVPVDWIVTPTQIIEVKPRLPKPANVFWNILSNRRLQIIPILKTLHDQDLAEKKDCSLKEVDSDPEERSPRPYWAHKNYPRRGGMRRDNGPRQRFQRPRENSAPPNTNRNPTPHRMKNRQSLTFRRKPVGPRSSSAKEQSVRDSNGPQGNVVERVKGGGDGDRPQRRKYFRRPKGPIAFSVKLIGITQGTRVRDLKAALSNRGVKPYDITWDPHRSQATLHFAKAGMLKERKPVIASHLSGVNVVEGFPVVLKAKVHENTTNYKLAWLLNNNPIDMTTDRYSCVRTDDGIAVLSIQNATSDDSGEYTLSVKNARGRTFSKCSVTVSGKTKSDTPEEKPSFVGKMEDTVSDVKKSLVFSVQFTGNPMPDVEWSKDGVAINQDDRIKFLCDGSKIGLDITPCNLKDSGEYKCKISNSLGNAECCAKGTVNDVAAVITENQAEEKKAEETPDKSIAVDEIIAALQDLKVKGEGEEEPKDSLRVEPSKPVSRIESTGISSV